MRHVFRVATFSAGFALALSGTALASPTFNLTFIAGTGAQAQTAFQSAAAYWASKFSDTVSIDLTVGTGALDPGILAQAGSTRSLSSYSAYRTAAVAAANQTSATDSAVATSLPNASALKIFMNYTSDSPNGNGSPTPYLDQNGGSNNTSIRLTNANAKALGLATTATTVSGCIGNCDAFIQFSNSNSFSYDYDRTNGIASLSYDFVGLAIHEIGHALGFISGVDILDGNSPIPNSTIYAPADMFTYVAPLDMFRCSTGPAGSTTAGADVDFTADTRTKSFSLDQCASTLGTFSTGINHGDGQQASHWKDNLGLGVMDPTAGTGELLNVTALDLLAFDAIGWELASSPVTAAPEPGVLLLGGTWVMGMVAARRARRRS